MGAVTFGIPKNLVLKLKSITNIDTFIETGTFMGGTTSWAAKNFKTVKTVEFSKDLFEATSKKLSYLPNIEFIFGNSEEKLKSILDDLHVPAIFWLDAHWCGGLTYGSDYECPLIKEIDLIIKHPQNHIILIDDARYFVKPPKNTHSSSQWPGLNEIIPALMRKEGYYNFVSEDVIASIPESFKSDLQPYFDSIHEHEFPGSGVVKNLKFAFRNISQKWFKR